jgi:hypothetical protein
MKAHLVYIMPEAKAAACRASPLSLMVTHEQLRRGNTLTAQQ